MAKHTLLTAAASTSGPRRYPNSEAPLAFGSAFYVNSLPTKYVQSGHVGGDGAVFVEHKGSVTNTLVGRTRIENHNRTVATSNEGNGAEGSDENCPEQSRGECYVASANSYVFIRTMCEELRSLRPRFLRQSSYGDCLNWENGILQGIKSMKDMVEVVRRITRRRTMGKILIPENELVSSFMHGEMAGNRKDAYLYGFVNHCSVMSDHMLTGGGIEFFGESTVGLFGYMLSGLVDDIVTEERSSYAKCLQAARWRAALPGCVERCALSDGTPKTSTELLAKLAELVKLIDDAEKVCEELVDDGCYGRRSIFVRDAYVKSVFKVCKVSDSILGTNDLVKLKFRFTTCDRPGISLNKRFRNYRLGNKELGGLRDKLRLLRRNAVGKARSMTKTRDSMFYHTVRHVLSHFLSYDLIIKVMKMDKYAIAGATHYRTMQKGVVGYPYRYDHRLIVDHVGYIRTKVSFKPGAHNGWRVQDPLWFRVTSHTTIAQIEGATKRALNARNLRVHVNGRCIDGWTRVCDLEDGTQFTVSFFLPGGMDCDPYGGNTVWVCAKCDMLTLQESMHDLEVCKDCVWVESVCHTTPTLVTDCDSVGGSTTSSEVTQCPDEDRADERPFEPVDTVGVYFPFLGQTTMDISQFEWLGEQLRVAFSSWCRAYDMRKYSNQVIHKSWAFDTWLYVTMNHRGEIVSAPLSKSELIRTVTEGLIRARSIPAMGTRPERVDDGLGGIACGIPTQQTPDTKTCPTDDDHEHKFEFFVTNSGGGVEFGKHFQTLRDIDDAVTDCVYDLSKRVQCIGDDMSHCATALYTCALNQPRSFWERLVVTSSVGAAVTYATGSPTLGIVGSTIAHAAFEIHDRSQAFDAVNTTASSGIKRSLVNHVLAFGSLFEDDTEEDGVNGIGQCVSDDSTVSSSEDSDRFGRRAAAMLGNTDYLHNPDPRMYDGFLSGGPSQLLDRDRAVIVGTYDPLMTGSNGVSAEYRHGKIEHLRARFMHTVVKRDGVYAIEYCERASDGTSSVSPPKLSRPLSFGKDPNGLNYVRHEFMGFEYATSVVSVGCIRVGDFTYAHVVPRAKWFLIGALVRGLVPHEEMGYYDPSPNIIDSDLLISRRCDNGVATTSIGRVNGYASCVIHSNVYDHIVELCRTHVSVNTLRSSIRQFCEDQGIEEPNQSLDAGMLAAILRAKLVLGEVQYTGTITPNVRHVLVPNVESFEIESYTNMNGHCCADFFNLEPSVGGQAFSLPDKRSQFTCASAVAGRVNYTTCLRMKPFLPNGFGFFDKHDITAWYCIIGKEFIDMFVDGHSLAFIAEPDDVLIDLRPEQINKHMQVSMDPRAVDGSSQAHLKDEVGNGKHGRVITEVRSFWLQLLCWALSRLFKEHCPAYCFRDNISVDEHITNLYNAFVEILIVIDLKTYDASQNALFKVYEMLLSTCPFHKSEWAKIGDALEAEKFNMVKMFGKNWRVVYNSLLSKMSGAFSTSLFNTGGMIMVTYVGYRTKRHMEPKEAYAKAMQNAHGGDDAIIADITFQEISSVGEPFGMMFTLENTLSRKDLSTHKPMKFLGRVISSESINNVGMPVVSVLDAVRTLKTLPNFRKSGVKDTRLAKTLYPDKSLEDHEKISAFIDKMANIIMSGKNTPVVYKLALRTVEIINCEVSLTAEELWLRGYDPRKWRYANTNGCLIDDDPNCTQRRSPDRDDGEFLQDFNDELEAMSPPRYFKHDLFAEHLAQADSVWQLMHLPPMVQFEDNDESDVLRKQFFEDTIVADGDEIVDEIVGKFRTEHNRVTMALHDNQADGDPVDGDVKDFADSINKDSEELMAVAEETRKLMEGKSETTSKDMRKAVKKARFAIKDVFGRIIRNEIVPKDYIEQYIPGGPSCGFSEASGYVPMPAGSFEIITLQCSKGAGCKTYNFWNDEHGERCFEQGVFYFQEIDLASTDTRQAKSGSFDERLPKVCWACKAFFAKRNKLGPKGGKGVSNDKIVTAEQSQCVGIDRAHDTGKGHNGPRKGKGKGAKGPGKDSKGGNTNFPAPRVSTGRGPTAWSEGTKENSK